MNFINAIRTTRTSLNHRIAGVPCALRGSGFIHEKDGKAVNFGIVYGISDYGLSRDLDIPMRNRGNTLKGTSTSIRKSRPPGSDSCQAYEDGYVTTMYNRKRLIPELSSSNYMQRQGGERIAMNTPIQGSAADIIKLAMIKVHKRLKKEKLASKLILQVHDELIIEAPLDEKDYVKELLVEEMERAVNSQFRSLWMPAWLTTGTRRNDDGCCNYWNHR